MDNLTDWINKKLEEGFSSDDIKKALKEEGFDPDLVDVVLQKQKSEVNSIKKRLLFLTIVLSVLILVLLFLMFSLEYNQQNHNTGTISLNKTNNSRYPSFFEKGFFVTTDKVPFKLIGDDLVFTNFSNKSMDFIILKVSRFNASLNKTVTLIDKNLRSTYSSIFFKKREKTNINDKTVYIEDVIIIETNYRKIIKNIFISYNNTSTLFFTYKCNELDKQTCDELIVEAIQHVSLVR